MHSGLVVKRTFPSRTSSYHYLSRIPRETYLFGDVKSNSDQKNGAEICKGIVIMKKVILIQHALWVRNRKNLSESYILLSLFEPDSPRNLPFSGREIKFFE